MTVDRKQLIREYKETPRLLGVGVVRHRASGKALLVAGIDVPALLNRHQAQLRLQAHRNKALQADWQRDGADAFEFVVLDTLKPAQEPDHDPAQELAVLEALWLDKLKPFAPAGYHQPSAGA